MKVLFPLVKAGSGSDIFTYNLVSGLNRRSVQADIQHLPSWSGYLPSIMGRLTDSAGYDIMHGNSWNGSGIKNDTPLVITAHSSIRLPELSKYYTIPQKFYYEYIHLKERGSIKIADRVCCVSRFTADYLAKMYDYHESKVIYNGIDSDFFSPEGDKYSDAILKNGEKTITLLFAGNRRVMKGFDLLPKIMKELGDGYRLLIAAGLRSGHNSDVSDRMHDLGFVSPQNMPMLYRTADIFLFPTRLEGFCLSVLEAMSCGLPVITTDTASLPEQIIDGKGGYLCPIDDISAFVDAIRHLGQDESLRTRMGRYNRRRVSDLFTLEKMTEEYLSVYTDLLQ